MNQNSLETDDTRLGEIVDEILSRMGRGENLEIDAYVAQHPEFAAILRQALPALKAMAESAGGVGIEEPTGFLSNRLLGDFRIRRELGRGGMGIVYEADQISLQRRVALKVLPFAGVVREQALLRFQNEVRAAATLNHPNIVAVYSVGEERGVHYYAMQLVRGQSMSAVISELNRLRSVEGVPLSACTLEQILSGQPGAASVRNASDVALTEGRGITRGSAAKATCMQPVNAAATAPAPMADTTQEIRAEQIGTLISDTPGREFVRSAAALGVQAARALQHAHENGILHRDIKPGNLLLDAEGKLFVADFGLARIENETALTATGDVLGTLRYMSPEQAWAKHPLVDGRSDIYSLGATLYELIALRPLFDSSDRQELLREIAFEEPTRLRKLDACIPRDLETVIHKAIEKDPADRYLTAGDLADDLQAFLDDRGISAHPPTMLEQVGRWSRRHAGLVWTMVFSTGVMALFALAALTVVNVVTARQRREAEVQAATANAVIEYITDDLLRAADPLNEPDRDIRLRTVVDRAAGQIESKLADHPLVAATIHSAVGETYHSLGEYQAAETQLQQALAIFQKHSGPHHRSTLECERKLANILLDQGREAEAEQRHRAVLQTRLDGLGDRHPDTLRSMSDLAAVGLQCGQPWIARRFLVHVAELREQSLGEHHPLTLTTQHELAEVLIAVGQTSEAEQKLRSVLAARQRLLGERHLDTLKTRSKLAELLLAQEKNVAHIQLEFQQIRRIATDLLGEGHPFVLESMLKLALSSSLLKNFDAAQEHAKQALALAEENIGTDHLLTYNIRLGLAVIHARRGQFQLAERILQPLSDVVQHNYGPTHPLAQAVFRQQLSIYRSLERTTEADLLEERLTATATDGLGWFSVVNWKQPFSYEEQQQLQIAENQAPVVQLEPAPRALNGIDGHFVNGARYVPGKLGQAFYFDGVDDRVIFADVAELAFADSLTIEGWICVDTFPATQQGHGVVVMRGDNRGGIDPYVLTTKPDGKIEFSVSDLQSGASISAEIPLDQWTHVAGVLDAEKDVACLYIDGQQVATTHTDVSPFHDLDPNHDPGVGIGNHPGYSGPNFAFHGMIEALQIHPRALSSDELARIAHID